MDDGDSGWQSFWGKARPVDGGGPDWHPLWMHALDVAATARVLAHELSPLIGQWAGWMAWPREQAVDLLVFLVALHDIGKFTRTFQKKAEAHWPAACLGPLDPATLAAADPGHPVTGLTLLVEDLGDLWDDWLPGWSSDDIQALLGPVVGHHGRPVEARDRLGAEICRKPEKMAARSFALAVRALLAPPRLAQPPAEGMARAGWLLAGLTVLADWIGSDQRYFPYRGAEPVAIGDYWQEALRRAGVAVTQAGLGTKPAGEFLGFHALTGIEGQPSPVQLWAEQVSLPPGGPCLFFIEDMTGSGKTEAALVLAQRLIAAGAANGLYFALPTMATANAAYARLARIYRRLFADGAAPSLVLAHGKARFHEGFTASIQAGSSRRARGDANPDGDSAAESTAWLASESRKALLADVGVGTVDQAVLAVLPARYQALRLLGLTGKVLIIDEAHAYDAYLGEELARLIGFMACLGSPVIVLSATLPDVVKRKLASAWGKAIGHVPPLLRDTAYPLASVIGGDGAASQVPLAPRPDLPRTLAVRRLPDAAAAVRHIVEAAAAGAAVAWVRNTVDDVLEGAALLRAAGLEPEVFHARMAMQDRLAIESAVVARFGKDGTAEGRWGRVLVASQVMEQSLDLDFDAMISDLAPIDLLLQRAGRLWRHLLLRPASGRPVIGPCLFVVSPDPVGLVDAAWFTRDFRRAGAVYADHLVLWRTAEILFREGQVQMPGDTRRFIEHVYGPDIEADAPEALLRSHNEALGKAGADSSHARFVLLEPAGGYQPGNLPWTNDIKATTRLIEQTTTLRLARWDGTTLRPWADAETPDLAWSLSELSVRANRVSAAAPLEGALARAAAEAVASWGRYDAEKVLVALTKVEEDWVGYVEGRAGPAKATCNSLTGLQFLDI